MIIVCALVATVGAKALETGIEKQIEQSLQIVGVSVDETYTNLYEGDYTRDKGRQGAQGRHIHFRGDTVDRWIAGEDRLPGVFSVWKYASDHDIDQAGRRDVLTVRRWKTMSMHRFRLGRLCS